MADIHIQLSSITSKYWRSKYNHAKNMLYGIQHNKIFEEYRIIDKKTEEDHDIFGRQYYNISYPQITNDICPRCKIHREDWKYRSTQCEEYAAYQGDYHGNVPRGASISQGRKYIIEIRQTTYSSPYSTNISQNETILVARQDLWKWKKQN